MRLRIGTWNLGDGWDVAGSLKYGMQAVLVRLGGGDEDLPGASFIRHVADLPVFLGLVHTPEQQLGDVPPRAPAGGQRAPTPLPDFPVRRPTTDHAPRFFNRRIMSHRDEPAFYTPAEVAAKFRVNVQTVSRWARERKLSCITTVGGHRRYPVAEVDQVHALGMPRTETASLNPALPNTPPGALQPRLLPDEARPQSSPLDIPRCRPESGSSSSQVHQAPPPSARAPVTTLVEDHFHGDPVPALLELANHYGIAIAWKATYNKDLRQIANTHRSSS